MAEKEIFDLSGRVALVTAGGHGLGREYCEAMAEFGADVACSDINLERAQETVGLIKRFGHQAIAIETDASKPDQIERMVKQTVTELGTIDILFCNAGGGAPGVRLHELAIEDWDTCLNLCLKGTFLCMRAVIPIMLKQKKGSIISTASVGGLIAGHEKRAQPNAAAYGAAKGGIINLTRHAAVQYAKDGIRVNAIAPGAHDTGALGIHGYGPQGNAPTSEVMKPPDPELDIIGFIPMGRIGKPSEIKGLAVYLASDASSYVTGQTFVEDGGFIA